jgi:hypothetical protein
MRLTIDRKSFLDIIAEGRGDINGAMQSPPAGLWGLPPEIGAAPTAFQPVAQRGWRPKSSGA